MGKSLKHHMKKGTLVLLIAVVSATIGIGHYLLTGGQISDFRKSAESILDTSASVISNAAEKAQGAAQALPSSDEAMKEAASSIVPVESGIRICFALCERLNPFGIEHAFLDFLNSAKASIFGVFFDFQLKDAADVLIQKHKDGGDIQEGV